jgi:hypothetical protein
VNFADVHELSGAFVLPSTDPLEHVHSHVVGNLARGEAVLGEEIEASIVVVVEELPAPAPLTVAGAHLLRHVGESAPLVVRQRRSRVMSTIRSLRFLKAEGKSTPRAR